MKKLLTILFVLSFFAGKAQWLGDSTYGKIGKGGGFNRTFLLPTGCGTPSNLSTPDAAKKMAAIYTDTCNHRFWVWDSKLSAWDSIHVGVAGGGGTTDSAVYVTMTRLRDSLANRMKYADSAAMLTNYKHWLAGYLTSASITGKLNTSDSAAMLLNYRHWAEGYLKAADIAGKTNNSDTASMLTNYRHWLAGYISASQLSDSLDANAFYVKNATTGAGQILYMHGDTVKAKINVAGWGFVLDSTTTALNFRADTSADKLATQFMLNKMVADSSALLRTLIGSGGGGVIDTLWTANHNAAHYELNNLSKLSVYRTVVSGGGGTTYATWNPSDKATSMSLSSGNLVATGGTNGSTHDAVRANMSVSTGKVYVEITATTVGSGVVGVGTSSANLNNFVGSDANGYGYKDDGEGVNNGNVFYGTTFTSGDVVGLLIDKDANTVEIEKNNTSQGTFTISGTVFPMVSSGPFSGCVFTANFGASAFSYSVPSGYNAGLYTSGGSTTYEQTLLIDSLGAIHLGNATKDNIADSDSLLSLTGGKVSVNKRSNFPTRPIDYISKTGLTSLPSDMTAVGSPTYTIGGGKFNFSGTGGGGANNISKYIRSNLGVLDECNTISATITVGTAPDANSYGASIGFKTYSTYGGTQSLTAGINMATGSDFGKVYVYSDYTTTMYYGAANTDINNGDTIKISLTTKGWTLRVFVKNYTQGWENELSLPNIGGFNPLTHNSAYPAFFHNGGTVSVDSFKYTINRPVLADIMFIGNSLTYGQGATQEFKRWTNKVGYSEFNIFSGGGSDVSQNIVDRLPHIIACNPRRVILHDVVGNDIAQAISSSIWMPNLRTIRNTLVAAGIEVIFTTGSPRTGLGTFLINQKNFIDTCADFAGDMKIDTWTALLGSGTEPYTDYFTDGVHYNDRGHEVMANTVNIALGYESNPGIRFGQNTLFTEMGYGSIYANETYGLTLRSGKGSTYDLTIFDRAGNLLMGNPTGTTHLVTAWNFGAGMAGVAAPSALLHVAPSTAGNGQIKLSNGTLPTAPEIGLLNHKDGLLFFDSSNSKRDTIATRDWTRTLAVANIGNSDLTQSAADRTYTIGYGGGARNLYLGNSGYSYPDRVLLTLHNNSTLGYGGFHILSKDSVSDRNYEINGFSSNQSMLFGASKAAGFYNYNRLYPDSTVFEVGIVSSKVKRYGFGIDSMYIKGNMPVSASSTDSILVRDGNGVIKTRAQSDIGGGVSDGDKADVLVTSSGATWSVKSVSGEFNLLGITSPSTYTSNQTDVSYSGATVIRINGDSDNRMINSISGGTDGRIIKIINTGATDIVIPNDDGTTGTATGRFDFNGVDVIIEPKESRDFIYDGTLQRWLKTTYEYDLTNVRRQPIYNWDYVAAGVATANYSTTAISSGTAAYVNTAANHPGYMTTTSSATTNSGHYSYYLNTTTQLFFQGGEFYECIYQPKVASNTNTTTRFGFLDATTITDAVDGAYFEIPTGSFDVVGKTSNNSTRTTSSAIATISVNQWYRFAIRVNRAASSISFTIYDSEGVSLGTQSITTNIPTTSTRVFGAGYISTNSGTSATLLGWLDYQGFQLGSSRPLAR